MNITVPAHRFTTDAAKGTSAFTAAIDASTKMAFGALSRAKLTFYAPADVMPSFCPPLNAMLISSKREDGELCPYESSPRPYH